MPEANDAGLAEATINHAVVEGKREHHHPGNPSRDEAGYPTGERFYDQFGEIGRSHRLMATVPLCACS